MQLVTINGCELGNHCVLVAWYKALSHAKNRLIRVAGAIGNKHNLIGNLMPYQCSSCSITVMDALYGNLHTAWAGEFRACGLVMLTSIWNKVV